MIVADSTVVKLAEGQVKPVDGAEAPVAYT
jgi:hypothetical protein